MKLLSCLVAVSLTCSGAAQARFSPAERRMTQHVEPERERSIERQTKQATLLMHWLNGEEG